MRVFSQMSEQIHKHKNIKGLFIKVLIHFRILLQNSGSCSETQGAIPEPWEQPSLPRYLSHIAQPARLEKKMHDKTLFLYNELDQWIYG